VTSSGRVESRRGGVDERELVGSMPQEAARSTG
jgi:hypothetical protein